MSEERTLDGNAAGGLLSEIFPFEMTVVQTLCGACGAMDHVGQLTLYTDAPGTVICCVRCGAVLIRVVRGGDRYWLDMSGVRCLQVGELAR